MKTLIVDDSSLNQSALKVLLTKYHPEMELIGDADSVKTALAAINKLNPELVFLDIELGDGTAFDMLQQIPHVNFSIIFLTAYNHYALEAFKVNAIDYLLKPISIDNLKKALNKVFTQNNSFQVKQLIETVKTTTQNNLIAISTPNEIEYIDYNKIVRLQAEGKYTLCVVRNRERPILSSKNLGEFEKILAKRGFFRTHHSHLINTKTVLKFSKKEAVITLDNGDEIPLSQRKKEAFLNFMSTI